MEDECWVGSLNRDNFSNFLLHHSDCPLFVDSDTVSVQSESAQSVSLWLVVKLLLKLRH